MMFCLRFPAQIAFFELQTTQDLSIAPPFFYEDLESVKNQGWKHHHLAVCPTTTPLNNPP